MAKMRISPELKKLIEKYRCVKDTEGMSPAIPFRFNPIQSNDSYGNYGALKPHTNKGLLPYHS